MYSWPSDAAILHFRPNDGSNARMGHKSSCESKRFTRLAWPSDGSICGQTMVQVTRRNRQAERSGGLHETERSAVKEAWGYPSGGRRAQVGRSGRQAKRCPNMRAEGTEETTGLAVKEPVSQNRRLEAFIVRDQIRERLHALESTKHSSAGVAGSVWYPSSAGVGLIPEIRDRASTEPE